MLTVLSILDAVQSARIKAGFNVCLWICEFLLYLESTPYTASSDAELVLKRVESVGKISLFFFWKKEGLGAICQCRCLCCVRVAKDLFLYQWG